MAGLLPTYGISFLYSGYKTISTSGGYSFLIKGKTALVSIYDDYYGIFTLFFVSEKGGIREFWNTSSGFTIEWADGVFTVKSSSGTYGCYIEVINLGDL